MDKRLPDLKNYNLIERTDVDDTVILTLKKKNDDFISPFTGEVETIPETGDLAIFWNPGKECKAIVTRLLDREFAVEYQELPYMASTREWYTKAIRFRNPEQLDKIINYKEDVAKKAKKN